MHSDDELLDYQLMEFLKRRRRPVQRKVDIIPRAWIHTTNVEKLKHSFWMSLTRIKIGE